MPTLKPNILFILTDDQAPWTFGAEGHPNAYTPELDRLAAQGARFDNLYANAAVCSPSRACLISGRYPTETGLAPDGNVYVVQKPEDPGLTPGLATWPQALREAGYRTALIGKWHAGHGSPEDLPHAKGYEHFAGWAQNGRVSRDPILKIDGEQREFPGQYTSDVLADLTMEHIRRVQGEPFAISLHFWAPHANHAVPADFKLPYADRTWLPMQEQDLAPWREMELAIPNPEFPNLDLERVRRMMREYYASVHSVDRNVGRIMRFLEEQGLAENTIVIFTSDQGYNMAHNGIWHKGNGWWITTDRKDPAGLRGKTRENLYDNSLRVPGIIRWPAGIRPGLRVPEMVSFVDWFPTIMEMAGAASPADALLRGRSFLPLLRGGAASWEQGLFAQHRSLRCYRDREWKLVRDFRNTGLDELYHVREDPFEKCNLINETHPLITAIREELDRNLLRVMAEIQDPMLQPAAK
ncbi:MAG: sulfatase [Kiritimatiellia bacterium]|nr:sulfatase-like hydrolase/transferase [Lentisphaerota bacterium]